MEPYKPMMEYCKPVIEPYESVMERYKPTIEPYEPVMERYKPTIEPYEPVIAHAQQTLTYHKEVSMEDYIPPKEADFIDWRGNLIAVSKEHTSLWDLPN
ncbi:hypothetical protein Holit_02467 [Hollandina sp. SP2]